MVATGRNRPQIEPSLAECGDRVLAVLLDVTSEARAQAAVEAAMERFGRSDVLVNDADYGPMGRCEEIDAVEIDRRLATNVLGLMYATRRRETDRRRRSGVERDALEQRRTLSVSTDLVAEAPVG